MPDQDASFMPDGGGNGDWHYLDGHSYNPLVYTGGELPWAMQWIFDNIILYFENGSWNTATQLMGAICHFTGDSTQPLHSTWNYNPNGKHSAYETTALNAHIGEISIPDNYLPQQLDNITAAALASLAKSFSYTAEGANPGDNNLTAFLDNNITWNPWIKSMTENRLRSAVQFTANVWYSAMIQSGLTIQASTLTSPSNGSNTTDNTPTFTWTSASGTSYYDFQLASDNNFTINARTVKGLTTNSCTPVAPLANGVWYWHVRTGDNATAVGLYSQTQSFTVTASTLNPPLVAISPTSNSGPNGALLTYTVTVTNTGTSSDNFNLTASDNASPTWGPTIAPTSLTIPAGENRTATLSVTVPQNAVVGTIDNISVTASGAGGNDSKSCTATVIASRGVSVSISPSENHAENGQVVTFAVIVHNTGVIADNYNLTISDSAGWGPTLDNNSFGNVLSGENRTTTLNVYIPDNAAPGNFDNITVTAISQSDSSVRDNETCFARSGNGRNVYLAAGWNLVGFSGAGATDSPNNVFAGLIYNQDYLIYSWTAPSGPYATQNPNTPLSDNIGYWIWINQNKMVTLSGLTPTTRDIHLVAGWNTVSFPVVNANTTPNNIFTGLTYYTDYSLSYWNAPGGPYGVQAPDQVLRDNAGYWLWINQDRTVTVP